MRAVRAGQRVAERFVLSRLAGRGGMGEVWEAVDEAGGQRVACKILAGASGDAHLIERFAREARLLASLEDETIVRCLGSGALPGGEPYILMEWLDGCDLETLLDERQLEGGETLALCRRVARALSLLHARGVVHRDLKPSNLFLVGGRADAVRLLDLGVAHLSGQGAAMTRVGDRIGTPRYMAPEQVRGERSLDGRADLFALGALLYRLIVGKDAFDADSEVAILARILFEQPPPPSELRPGLGGSEAAASAIDRVLASMLAKRREDRPPDVAAWLALLDEIAEPLLRDSASSPAPLRTMVLQRRPLQSERRSASIVLLQGFELDRTGEATNPGHREAVDPLSMLRGQASLFGLRLDRIGERNFVLTHLESGVVRDLAARSIRAASALRQFAPQAVLSVATGLIEDDEHTPIGSVIDRAARQAARVPVGSIVVDEVTESLLDARFVVEKTNAGRLLRAISEEGEPGRTLLGQRAPYVGREREQASLLALVTESGDEQVARVALVTGAPGAGKSRLRQEVARQIGSARPDVLLWRARGDALRTNSPYGLLSNLLSPIFGLASGDDPSWQAERIAAGVATIGVPASSVATVARLVGELLGLPSQDAQLVAARRDPAVLADLVRSAWLELLSAATERPLVLLLDDLQWADAPSLRLLDAALEIHRERPLCIIGMARPEIHELFPKLFVERGVSELRLQELGRRACERLVAAVLGDLPRPAVERLVAMSMGNAFFLEELVRTVAESGVEAPLPESVLGMVEARLLRLSPDERRVLRAASIFGETCWSSGLVAVLGDEVQAADLRLILHSLRERELLSLKASSRFADEEEHAFRHALLREGAYATLTEEDRRSAHRRAAAWLQSHGERDALLLAQHAERGGDRPQAGRFYQRAAEQSAEANDLVAARQLADRAIALTETPNEQARVTLLLTEIASWQGDWQRGVEEAERTMTLGAEDDRLLLELAPLSVLCNAQVGNESRAVAMAEALERRFAGRPVQAAEAMAMARVAAPLILRGHLAIVERLIATFEDRLDELSPPGSRERAFLVDALALHAMFVGDLPRFRALKRVCVDCFVALGQKRHEALQRVWLGYACLECGDFEEAVRELEAVLVDGERFALGRIVALAKHNLGAALGRRPGASSQDLERAVAIEAEAVSLFDAQHDVRLLAAARAYLAEILALAGRFEEAHEAATLAHQMAPPGSPASASAAAMLAQILVARDDPEAARAPAIEAEETLRRLGGTDEGEGSIRCAFAEALLACGELDAGREALTLARRRLDERAARFDDEAARAGFLSIPSHRRTLALCERYLVPAGA